MKADVTCFFSFFRLDKIFFIRLVRFVKLRMKLLILICVISTINCSFFGCPMDGCDRSLSSFVDVNISQFDRNVFWQRTDLLNKTTRGCVSNSGSSLICSIDNGYVGVNITNGQILWLVPMKIDERSDVASLPIVNFNGYSIIANSSGCTLINAVGDIIGTFNYNPA